MLTPSIRIGHRCSFFFSFSFFRFLTIAVASHVRQGESKSILTPDTDLKKKKKEEKGPISGQIKNCFTNMKVDPGNPPRQEAALERVQLLELVRSKLDSAMRCSTA